MMEGKLPKGWKVMNVGDTLVLEYGKSLPKSKRSGTGFPVMGSNGEIDRHNEYLVEGPGIVVGRKGSHGEVVWVEENFFPIDTTYFVRTKPFIDLRFSFYFLSNTDLKSLNRSTAIPGLNRNDAYDTTINLPPLSEQQRIVAKLDTLFEHLDSLREKLDRIPRLLKNFRQQVLTQAVTGELTKEKIKIVPLGEYLEDIKYGTSKKSEYKVEGVPILRIPNIDVDKGVISISNMKYSKLDEKEYEKLKLREGDILIIRSNGSVSLVGQSAIIQKEEIDFAYAGYLVRLRSVKGMLPKFLNYMLKSNFLRSQIVETARSTSGVNNINTTEIKSLRIPFTSIENQKAITDRIEMLFDLADKIESQYQSLKVKIDQLPQAILAKAFRGELVEQEVKEYEIKEGEGLIAAEPRAKNL